MLVNIATTVSVRRPLLTVNKQVGAHLLALNQAVRVSGKQLDASPPHSQHQPAGRQGLLPNEPFLSSYSSMRLFMVLGILSFVPLNVFLCMGCWAQCDLIMLMINLIEEFGADNRNMKS